MKIGFDAKRLYNNFTGLGNYSRTLLQSLYEFFPEDEHYLYTPKIRHTPETELFLKNPAYRTYTSTSPVKSLWRSYGIKKNLKQDQIELYHGLSHEIPVNIHKTHIRSVVTIHDIIYKTYPDMFPAIDRTIYDLKFKYSCRHADKIIAISESTKKDIIRYYGIPEEKIAVIYQAINPIFYHPQAEYLAASTLKSYHIPDEYILYVGAINSRKNLLGIIKAYAMLPETFKIPLVIVGNGGKYKEEVLKYAGSHGLLKNLIILHNLADSKIVQALYQKAQLFIYPSFYEGFGLPVTEALLSKTPVITSDISSLPEAGGPDTCYVNPTDTEAIAYAIETVLSDQDKRKTMIENGCTFAQQQFNIHTLTQQVHQLYQQLL